MNDVNQKLQSYRVRPSNLARDMNRLVGGATRMVKRGLDHYAVCHLLAKKFDLYDAGEYFPIWLSRVVDGIIRDLEFGL